MVVDRAALMTDQETGFIAAYHRLLLLDHDVDYRVLTIKETGNINQASHEAFRSMSVGEASTTGRGLLLVIDPAEKLVRLEVSAALEGVYTDALVSYVERHQMVPFFQNDRVADGILAATELIVARAQEAEIQQAFDPRVTDSLSLGGGATVPTTPTATITAAHRSGVDAGGTPAATIAAYLAAMRKHDARPDLAVYSSDTQSMLRSWTITRGQMDHVVKTYRQCSDPETIYHGAGNLAVIRYGIGDRSCAPWLLRLEDGHWLLDLAASQQALRFNHRNQWRFEHRDHAYAFGFRDWRFDRHGFPVQAN